jgi:putative NADH-flavin reductase
MKIQQTTPRFHFLILGAGGGIGKQCVILALAAGHQVTAVMRNPAKLPITHERLRIIKGDITDPASFFECLKDTDAVVSAIGISSGLTGNKPTTLYSQGAANILQGLKESGGKRAFFISASALDVNPLVPFYFRLAVKYILQKLLKHMYADQRLMEELVKSSGTNWTVIRPPRLTDDAPTGKYRIAINSFLKNCMKISRADVAHFIINNTDNSSTYRAVIEIAY